MSQETERIPVPTNGKGPHPIDRGSPPPDPPDSPSDSPSTVAFTPTQLAVGFGIIASLIVLGAGWLRRNRQRSRWPLG